MNAIDEKSAVWLSDACVKKRLKCCPRQLFRGTGAASGNTKSSSCFRHGTEMQRVPLPSLTEGDCLLAGDCAPHPRGELDSWLLGVELRRALNLDHLPGREGGGAEV